jgi:hypothetical protein
MKEIEGSDCAHENGDTPRLLPARASWGQSTIWKSVQSGLILHVQVDTYALGEVLCVRVIRKWGIKGDGRVRTFGYVNFTAVRP